MFDTLPRVHIDDGKIAHRGTAMRNVAPNLHELITIKTKMLQMVKQTLHQEQWIRGIISLLSVQA